MICFLFSHVRTQTPRAIPRAPLGKHIPRKGPFLSLMPEKPLLLFIVHFMPSLQFPHAHPCGICLCCKVAYTCVLDEILLYWGYNRICVVRKSSKLSMRTNNKE